MVAEGLVRTHATDIAKALVSEMPALRTNPGRLRRVDASPAGGAGLRQRPIQRATLASARERDRHDGVGTQLADT